MDGTPLCHRAAPQLAAAHTHCWQLQLARGMGHERPSDVVRRARDDVHHLLLGASKHKALGLLHRQLHLLRLGAGVVDL